MTILKYRKWLYLFSTVTLIFSLGAIATFGIPKGIDFTGGTVLELQCLDQPNDCLSAEVEELVYTSQLSVKSIQSTGADRLLIKLPPLRDEQLTELRLNLSTKQYVILRVETVGPAVSRALTKRAVLATFAAALVIIGYIAFAFRGLRSPLSPWRFGATATVAMVHDVGVVLGIFALLARLQGHTFEANSELVAALLTVIGFSVHDTIVVFDRIRENVLKGETGRPPSGGVAVGEWFLRVADYSLVQTVIRSLNTSITTLLALLALVVFGGPSVVGFATVLFIGILTGTYSSIFVATPLLVDWQYVIARRSPGR